ncbi:uncharacterized protein BO96DRAFT_357508 [Aspergillus niger CBS 101883]|uniref:Uncharacterized protein n=2 Tax=Aspergillus niger TaxID=5061 RepID=A2R7A1_ASPNC|nr:uncharacterized protein BO96DRAFT_357508 [Aspergillus niger CBS 101883]XP_059605600.1 hypothetical protein An16g02800 [Aspergillus niger]PYH61659.1 hypothetical protein BO96DRAFT_357508 [Aspergillus niger CBS 101883]CAK48590.1 hypothetical protein An16g02800 [Aspergillus niger]
MGIRRAVHEARTQDDASNNLLLWDKTNIEPLHEQVCFGAGILKHWRARGFCPRQKLIDAPKNEAEPLKPRNGPILGLGGKPKSPASPCPCWRNSQPGEPWVESRLSERPWIMQAPIGANNCNRVPDQRFKHPGHLISARGTLWPVASALTLSLKSSRSIGICIESPCGRCQRVLG